MSKDCRHVHAAAVILLSNVFQVNKFERTTCKCPKKPGKYERMEEHLLNVWCKLFTRVLVTLKLVLCCVESVFCAIFVISGILKGVQHLLLVYCSLNGNNTFTGIDGSIKLFGVMYNWKYLSASSICSSQNKETCGAAFYPDMSVRSFSTMQHNREMSLLLQVEPTSLKGTQHPFNFC